MRGAFFVLAALVTMASVAHTQSSTFSTCLSHTISHTDFFALNCVANYVGYVPDLLAEYGNINNAVQRCANLTNPTPAQQLNCTLQIQKAVATLSPVSSECFASHTRMFDNLTICLLLLFSAFVFSSFSQRFFSFVSFP
jgi:hypothetical protein